MYADGYFTKVYSFFRALLEVTDSWFRKKLVPNRWRFYSETTWAVGIAQLTHHEVQGGGKNPQTEGRGIFSPTADRVVS